MKKLPTVTIGIPAHNERENIHYLLMALLSQHDRNYKLDRIVVFCDGCVDNTAALTKEIAKANPMIRVIDDGKRMGKIGRLQELYEMNTSDIVINVDADTLPADEYVIGNIVKELGRKNVTYVSGNVKPMKEVTFIEKLVNAWDEIWRVACETYKNGQTVHHAMSAIQGLRRDFAKNVVFPDWAISDGAIIYLTAKKQSLQTRYAREATVFARSATTVRDYLMVLSRYSTQRRAMRTYFGRWIDDEFDLPNIHKYTAMYRVFLAHPVLTPMAIGFQLVATKLAQKTQGMETKNFWKEVKSTKKLVNPMASTA